MGELLAGAALALLGTSVAAIPAAWRGAIGWFGVLGIVIVCLGFDETIPWPSACRPLLVVATMAVIVAGASTSPPWAPATWPRHPRCSGSAVTPTPSPLALAGARARRGRMGAAQLAAANRRHRRRGHRCARRCPCASSRTRCATRYFAALSWRSLSLGLAMCVLVIGVGWDLRASSIRLDGGVQAAARNSHGDDDRDAECPRRRADIHRRPRPRRQRSPRRRDPVTTLAT